jgi:hypothetical protein
LIRPIRSPSSPHPPTSLLLHIDAKLGVDDRTAAVTTGLSNAAYTPIVLRRAPFADSAAHVRHDETGAT